MNNLTFRPTKIPVTNELLKQYLPLWQNNNENYLGIIDFCFRLFPNAFNPKYGVAKWARNALKEVLKYKPGMTKEDRCHVIATFREGSKTTWFAYGLVLYVILVGQYGIYWEDNLLPNINYVIYKSKTGKEARKRLLNVRISLALPTVKKYFGEIVPNIKQIRSKEAKDESNLLILPNSFVLEAIGINQPIRGANVLNRRPNLVIYDDPEHLENTKTDERRENNEKDLLEETYGALSSDGMIIYIGNRVHHDDLLGKLLNNKSWHKQFYQLSNLLTKRPDEPHISEWPEKFPPEYIEKMKNWYETHDKLGYKSFLKNYYNVIPSDSDYKIKYYEGEYFRQDNINWIRYIDEYGEEKIENLYIVVGNDPAISDAKDSSNSSIVVVGFTPTKKRFVLEAYTGKMDLHDKYVNDELKVYPFAYNPDDIAKLYKRGNCEEIARKVKKYYADCVVIETAGQQKVFFIETKELLYNANMYPVMIEYVPNINKISKLKEGLLIFFELGYYYVKKNMTNIISEVETFPHSKLDTLDALFLCEKGARIPNKIEYGKVDYSVKNNTIVFESVVDENSEPWIVF